MRCGSGSVFLRVILALILNVDDGPVYFEAASATRRGGREAPIRGAAGAAEGIGAIRCSCARLLGF